MNSDATAVLAPSRAVVLRFDVDGVAQPKGSARAFVPKGWTRAVVTTANPQLKAWTQLIRTQLQGVLVRPGVASTVALLWDAPVRVTLDFHLPRPKSLPRRITRHTRKPDLDKLARGAIDALTGLVIRDDAHVVELFTRKVYATRGARCAIRIERID